MSILLGYDAYDFSAFESPLPPVRDIDYIELSNSVIDEVHARERTDIVSNITKTEWQVDTLLKFTADDNSLEAGNISNSGIIISDFAVKRREVDSLETLTIARIPFVNNEQVVYTDYLQGNKEYVYSIVPVGINGLEGKPTETTVESSFVGVFVVDKEDTSNILAFDKIIGDSQQMFNTQLNQGRTEIRTLSPFPTVFYDDSSYHSFTLEGAFLPEENARSNKEYDKLLRMINKHVPVLVKSSNGFIAICDISNPRVSTPQNSHRGYDYQIVQLDSIEIMTLREYIEG